MMMNDPKLLIGKKGEFTAAWGEVCQCEVTGTDEEPFFYNPDSGDHEDLGTILVINYVTCGRVVTGAFLEPEAFRPNPTPDEIRKWLEFYHNESFRLGTTNDGARSAITGLLRENAALVKEREALKMRLTNTPARMQEIQRELDSALDTLAERDREIEELKGWKESAIAVMPDYQEIGRLLDVQVGDSVHDKIVPGIQSLRSQLQTAKEENAVLKSQVENADVNLEQVRIALNSRHQKELQAATARAEEAKAVMESQPDLTLIEEVRADARSIVNIQRYDSKGRLDCHGIYVRYDSVEHGINRLLARLNPRK